MTLFNKLVEQEVSGTPDGLAARLQISRSSLFELLDELRSRNVPIAYSKQLRSYRYTSDFEMDILP